MKKRVILIVSAMVAIMCCCICGCSKKQEESHRIIQVLDVAGTVTVERTDIGVVEVYEGMRLQSGDIILVEQESWLKLQMDEDKYALVEPDSKLRLEAEGNSADSKTRIYLEAGAISNRLESELSDQSVYEVNTPNSTMAVRGTVFRVEVSYNEDNLCITNVSVYNGMVESRLIYPDGTIEGENKAVKIVSGKGVQIWGDDITSDYISKNDKIDLEPLLLNTLYFLKESYSVEQELGISEKKLDELIETLENGLELAETETETIEEETPEEESESIEEESQAEEAESIEEEGQSEELEENSISSNGDDSNNEDDADNGGGANNSDGSDTDNNDDSGKEEPKEPAVSKYKVTFTYQGNVFATQNVEKNATAAMPLLQPTASGEWAYDFSTPITADITIEWTDSTT